MLPTRRFYSQGFNIASYVARIEDIAKKQSKPKAAGAQEARSGSRGKKSGPQGAKGSKVGTKASGPQGVKQANATAKPAGASGSQTRKQVPRKQWVKRPEGTQPVATAGASEKTPQTPRGPQTFQRRAESSPSTSQKPLIPPSGASQAFIYAEAKTRRPAPRAKPAGRGRPNNKKGSGAKRVAAVARTNVNAAGVRSVESVPLVISAKESIDAVLQNSNTTFITVDPLTPRSIATSLVQGPSFNARFWSVVNQSQNTSNVQSAVQSQINGDFSSLLISDEKITQNVARTLNANASLSSDQKQFLAKVSAGGMAPSQVKQVRI